MNVQRSIVAILAASALVTAGVTLESRSGSETIRFSYDTPSFSVDTVSVDGSYFSRLAAKTCEATTLTKGYPELPYDAVAVKLEGSGEATLTIESVTYEEIDVLPVLPSKGVLTRNINPDTVALTPSDFYTKDEWFPNSPASLESPYSIRSVRGASVRIYPFSYNPATGKLRVVKDLVVSVAEENSFSARAASNLSEEFQSVVESRFLSYDENRAVRYSPVYDGDKMIIITAAEYLEAAETLADWKNQKGIQTEVFTYPAQTGGTGYASLKDFIQTQYNSSDISYITLVGDAEDIPSKLMDYSVPGDSPSQDDNDVSSDPYYTFLSGNDSYPDAFVGRISVESASQAQSVVDKIISYEKYPELNGTWYNNAVSIGSNEGTPADYQWMQDSINPALTYGGFDDITEIYQGYGESNQQLTSAVNNGVGIVNFMGHGNNDSFLFGGGSSFRYRSSDVERQQNGNRTPVVIPLACQFGTFKGRTVVAETWLRKANGGAVAIMGSTPLMDWTPPQYAQVEMARLIAENKHNSMGAYFYNGEMKMLDLSSGKKTMNTWIYFGDPSLQLITTAPKAIDLSVSGDVVLGESEITVSGEDGVLVTLYSKELNIQKSEYINGGTASFQVGADNLGTIYVTGTDKNAVPYLDSLQVQEVQEENVAPTDILLSSDTVQAESMEGTLVATLTAVDDNARDKHIFTLDCTCEGLELKNDSLVVTGPLEEGVITMLITAVDPEGLAISKEFQLTVTPNRFYNIVAKEEWYSETDSAGSTAECAKEIKSNRDILKGKIKRAKTPNYDKWANVATYLESSLDSVENFTITYSATDSLKLVFPMDSLIALGAGHYLPLPSTNGEMKTITFTTESLVQPSWIESTMKKEFVGAEVYTAMVEVASEDTTEAAVEFSIYSLGLEGYEPQLHEVGVLTGNAATPQAFSIQGISTNQLSLGVSTSGTYKVELFSLNGRQLLSEIRELSAGYQQVALSQTQARGVVILRIAGPNMLINKKVLLQ